MISCIAFNPDRSGLYAAGSFSRTVGLYSENGDELLDLLGGHAGGITQVTFSPDGNYLYTAARRDSEIICWDLRQTGGEVFRLPRAGDTNQRIAFDIHSSGRWLSTGDAVRVFFLLLSASVFQKKGNGQRCICFLFLSFLTDCFFLQFEKYGRIMVRFRTAT